MNLLFDYSCAGTCFIFYRLFAPHLMAWAARKRRMNGEQARQVLKESIDMNFPGEADLSNEPAKMTLGFITIMYFAIYLFWPIFLGIDITYYWKIYKKGSL
jgi:hypothetical protein